MNEMCVYCEKNPAEEFGPYRATDGICRECAGVARVNRPRSITLGAIAEILNERVVKRWLLVLAIAACAAWALWGAR
jgi:hypothetical protein